MQEMSKPIAYVASDGDDIEDIGFAKLHGQEFEFFMQTYEMILGRDTKKEKVDLDLSVIGGGKDISRHHACIFYDFKTHLFFLEVLGQNGCTVQGTFYRPGDDPVKLKSQDLIQIGELKFYFLLPRRSIFETLAARRAHVPSQPPSSSVRRPAHVPSHPPSSSVTCPVHVPSQPPSSSVTRPAHVPSHPPSSSVTRPVHVPSQPPSSSVTRPAHVPSQPPSSSVTRPAHVPSQPPSSSIMPPAHIPSHPPSSSVERPTHIPSQPPSSSIMPLAHIPTHPPSSSVVRPAHIPSQPPSSSIMPPAHIPSHPPSSSVVRPAHIPSQSPSSSIMRPSRGYSYGIGFATSAPRHTHIPSQPLSSSFMRPADPQFSDFLDHSYGNDHHRGNSDNGTRVVTATQGMLMNQSLMSFGDLSLYTGPINVEPIGILGDRVDNVINSTDKDTGNQQLQLKEEEDIISCVATLVSNNCAPREWMPVEKLHSELIDHFGKIWPRGKVQKHLITEDGPSTETILRPWYNLLELLKKHPEHFIISTITRGTATSEFVALSPC